MRRRALKLLVLLVTCLSLARCQSNYDSEQTGGGNDDGDLAGERSPPSSTNCVFIGCSCGDDEGPYFSQEAEYAAGGGGGGAADQKDSYGQGYDVTCTLKENDPKVFPERDTGKQYSNKITSIELISGGIEDIPDNRFNGLEVNVADFSKNELRSLSPHVFDGIVRLEVLDLSNNKINSLSEETFQPIAATLIQLKLNHNRLAEMDPAQLGRVLAVLVNLKTLILRHNELVVLPDLTALERLEEVNLANNQLESLSSERESGRRLLPASISDLNLENNRLKHIRASTFAGLSNLKYLNLESNQITQIDEQSFAHLTRLSTLNLGKNALKHIPSHIFVTLVNLDRLDLSAQNSMLKEIEDFAFDRSSNTQIIRRIDLSKNRIAKIGNKAFCSRNQTYPYVNIKDIDMGGNQLTGLNACILRQLSKGYSDFQALKVAQSVQLGQPVPKPRLLFKTVHFVEKMGPFVRCDCEITRALNYVDLDGECEYQPGIMQDLKNYQCGNKQENVEESCQAQLEFECATEASRDRERERERPSSTDRLDTVNKPGEVQKDKKVDSVDGGKSQIATKSPSSALDGANAAMRIQGAVALLIFTILSSYLISF